jgi:hypothetical protein
MTATRQMKREAHDAQRECYVRLAPESRHLIKNIRIGYNDRPSEERREIDLTRDKQTDKQLRRLIRKMVKEELEKMFPKDLSAPPNPFDDPAFDHDYPSPPPSTRSLKKAGNPPPWAVFGSPQLDPERHPEKGKRPMPPPEWPVPFTPGREPGMEPPPFIPKRNKQR